MNRKHLLTGSLSFLGISILILDGKTALTGVQTGIDLCIKTLIPSLFPFIFLSTLLTSTLSNCPNPLLRPIGRLFSIPEGTEGILLTGFLGGYPTGAQAVATAYRKNRIQKDDADRMLSFCSNAGPSFLFGMAAPLFSSIKTAFALWGIHLLSAFLVAQFFPCTPSVSSVAQQQKDTTLPVAMHNSILVMATVCGWVIVFRVILAFLERWILWMFPEVIQIAIFGTLELSNGCYALSQLNDLSLRFVICSGILAWGGLCVVLQTSSVTEGLSLKAYLKGKVLQTFFSLLVSASVILNIWVPAVSLLLFMAMLIQKLQKRSSNPVPAGV